MHLLLFAFGLSRLSAQKVEELLPPLIVAIQKADLKVVWQCDPMHGNTVKTNNGYKTRNFDTILEELVKSFEIHTALGLFSSIWFSCV